MPTNVIEMKNYRKDSLTQDEVQMLMTYIVLISQTANFAELNAVLTSLQNTLTEFQRLIHPVEKSDLTDDVKEFDKVRDKYVTGLYFFVQFALRHYDPAMVAAAEKIDAVLNDTSYKNMQRNAYDRETGKIINLLEEINANCADAVVTLNLTSYLQALDSANQSFHHMYNARNMPKANNATAAEIREARTDLENSFDLFRKQLSLLAALNPDGTPTSGMGGTGSGMTGGTGGGMTGGMGGTGTGTGTPTEPLPVAHTYAELITYINDRIDRITAAAKHRQTMVKKSKENAENGGTTPTPENPTNNNGSDNNGENGGDNNGENTNTDNGGFGDENTPSANA